MTRRSTGTQIIILHDAPEDSRSFPRGRESSIAACPVKQTFHSIVPETDNHARCGNAAQRFGTLVSLIFNLKRSCSRAEPCSYGFFPEYSQLSPSA